MKENKPEYIKCGCNSIPRYKIKISIMGIKDIFPYCNSGKFDRKCPNCGYYYYIDAFEMNHHFDLQRMNQ